MNINELVEAVKAELEILSYSKHTRKVLNRHFGAFQSYMAANSVDSYTAEIGAQFLREKYGYPFVPDGRLRSSVQDAARSIELLSSYQETGAISRRRRRKTERTVNDPKIQKVIDDYILSIKDNHRGVHAVKRHIYDTCEFVEYLFSRRVYDLEAITADDISAYIGTFIGAAHGTRKEKLYHLRYILRFLHQQQITKIDLSLAVPHLRLGYNKYVPEPFTPSEIEQFYSAIDTGTALGKRDFAIVQMINHLGMRSIDVRLLKFENINGVTGILRFIQSKTQQPMELPMSEEVVASLTDYLQNGRPDCDSDYVFVRHCAPYKPLNGLSDICRRYLKKDNTAVDAYPKRGLHSLRHALATQLLNENVPPEMIAQILGHVNNRTVKEYMRMDFNKLGLCAIDPDEVFTNG